jgi:hypothetical protein
MAKLLSKTKGSTTVRGSLVPKYVGNLILAIKNLIK